MAEWVKPLATVHAGQGLLPVRVEAWVHPLRVIGLSACVHAIGLFLVRHRGFTCVLFKMWQVAAAKSRESCLAAVGAAGGILILQAMRLVARWPTCRLPARPRASYGPYGRERACSEEGASRPTGRSRAACQKRNRSRVEIGRHTKYNTKFSLPLLFPTYTSRIHTDTSTSPLRVVQWAHLCGLGAVA